MRRAPLAVTAVAVSCLAWLTGCNPGTVELGFHPTEGATYGYRYDVSARIVRSVDGAEPEETEVRSRLDVDQRVLRDEGDEVLVEADLRRDDELEGKAIVRLDRAGLLAGTDLVTGMPTMSLGLTGLDRLVPAAATAPPDRALRPGERWEVELGSGDGGRDVAAAEPITGWGRLERLGVIDGHDVAVVRTELRSPLDAELRAGSNTVSMTGDQRATAVVTYDLEDGAIRELRSRTEGEATALVEPPPGQPGQPVPVELRFELVVDLQRTA